MTENIQKGFIPELIDITKLLTFLAIRRLNLQHALYLTAFLTFGVGDAVTGAYMMNTLGAGIEANPIVSYLFMTQGPDGVVIAKMWFTFVILFVVYIIQLRSPTNMYWTVNGFLAALAAGGLMAVNANLSAVAGNITAAPGTIIFTYLSLMLVLTEIGSFADEKGIKYDKT